MHKLSPIVLLLALALTGCGKPHQQQVADAIAAFKDRDTIEFLYITLGVPARFQEAVQSDAADPDSRPSGSKIDYLSGYRVLAKTTLDPAHQERWLTGIHSMVSAGGPAYLMRCFNPAYALCDPSSPEDFILVCFECSAIRCYGITSSNRTGIDINAAPELLEEFADFAKSLQDKTHN